MRKSFFKLLLSINNRLLPRFAGKVEPTELSKFQQAILAYRYWVLTNAL
jgi:hypothetical protein